MLSLEPSLYVTTTLFPSLVMLSIRLSWFSTSVPFLSARFLSGFSVEYWILIFFLISLNSASVTLLASTTGTFVSGALMSYFLVCAFNTRVNAPGSVAYEFPTAVFSIIASSRSVAVA